jgi:hypothetical protein
LKHALAIFAIVAVLMGGVRADGPHPDGGGEAAVPGTSQAVERAIGQELSRRGGVGASVAIVAKRRFSGRWA